MSKLILHRLLSGSVTLLVLITVCFFMMRFAPGNPFTAERSFPPQIMKNIEAKYGFNKPIHEQYITYLSQVIKGDLGPSFRYKDFSVNQLVAGAFPVSAKLGLAAFIITLLFGVGIGILAALKQNTWLDYLSMSTSMIGIVTPSFVIAPLLILVFAIQLQWLPAGGWHEGNWRHMLLPVVALALLYIATFARITRASMIETLHSNFIRTAKAKGLPQRQIIFKHALKPALLPVISYMGPAFVGIITGSVVIESIFGLPGIGQLLVQGAYNRDYSLVLGLVILVGVLTITFNAIVDILYAFIDPKINY